MSSAFTAWLSGQINRADPIGDLARDTRADRDWPPTGKLSRSKLRRYLASRNAIPEAIDALDAAWDEWDAVRRDPP